MDIVIIIIIIGLFAYILFGKKPEVKKKYDILYGLEKNDLIPEEKQILEEKKKLYKEANFKIPEYELSNRYNRDYSNIPGPRTVNYQVSNDKTKINLFIKDLVNEIDSTNRSLSGPIKVGGLTGLSLKSRAEVYVKNKNDARFIKDQNKIYSKYVIKPYLINIKPSIKNWGIYRYFKKHENSQERFNTFDEFRQQIVRPLEKMIKEEYAYLFKKHAYKEFYNLTLSPGNYGKSLWIRIYLKVSAKDFVIHNSSLLTEIGKKNSDKIAEETDLFLKNKNLSLLNAYNDKHFRSSLLFLAENNYRKKSGLPLIGDGWINQAELREGIKDFISNVKNEYSPKWLSPKRLDIYIPSHKLAIEYHGQQHYEAVDFFGGQEAFEKRVADDKIKKDLCLKNNLSFVEWPYLVEVNEKNISKMIDYAQKNKEKKFFINMKDLI